MRYLAPDHVSSVYLNSGEVKVEDGVAFLADDAPAYDHQALRSAGFVADHSAEKEEEPELKLALELPSDDDA